MEFKMSELIDKLNEATLAYDEGKPIMTDKEWDDLYFALLQAESQSGIRMSNSPTQVVNYEVVNALEKVEHSHKMLSLDKTKSIDEVNAFLGDKPFIAMCKMDGLTCSLHYSDGKLVSAETRGNGIIGEDILHNALVVANIPNRIAYTESLIVDGEIICTYEDFKEFEENYKNPRNFASGSIRLLDSEECSKRKLSFIAWEVIEGFEEVDELHIRLGMLERLGFEVVPRVTSETGKVDEGLIDLIKVLARHKSYPIDGVVFKFDSISYGRSLGETAHHFRNAIAFKFYDDIYETTLTDIEWTMGRTGVLTPVAVFEPVDIDGSVVERASLHNVSIMEEVLGKQPWIGEPVGVYKANMIIPQIGWARQEMPEGEIIVLSYPTECPICGGGLTVRDSDGVKTLVCTNKNCEGQFINILDHFCGKKGLDIKGLSKATLEKLIDKGWVNTVSDIFSLKNHSVEWMNLPGFGSKSVQKILDAIEESKNTSLEAFISSLGIPLIGRTVSKELVKHFASYPELREKINNRYDFSQIDGFAQSKTDSLLNYDYSEADKIYEMLNIQVDDAADKDADAPLSGMTIVITGKLNIYKNRAELQKVIEDKGGKVVGSVSKNTNILINNDAGSQSAKNVAAQKLGISVLTEQEFKELFVDIP